MLMSDQEDKGTMDLQSVSDPVEDDASAPPVIVPEDGGDPSGGRPRPKWLVPVIAAVVAAVVAVAGLVGWRVVESRRHDAALDSCSRAVEAVQGRTGSDHMAHYREAAGIKADQVKDAKTVLAMARSVKDAEGLKQPAVQCKASMSAADLNAEAGKARKLDSRFAAVAKSAGAVLASRDAKALDDAKAALDGKKGEASRLLADSDGKVADSATRDGLQKAIGQAGGVKGGKAKAYQDAANALQAAIDQVNASVQAKSQAAQQAAPSNNYGRSGYTPSYQPSANRGGGYTPAPAPAAPQGGGSGSGSSAANRLPPLDTTHHGCNPDGSCGIG